MKIGIIGTGYVGLVTGTCFSDTGNNVICMDIDENKINMLNNGQIPIYEPGLEVLVSRNTRDKRLEFTTDIDSGIQKSDIIFIAVGTPPGPDGHADLKYILSAAEKIGKNMNDYKIIVDKSTVPVGTSDLVKAEIKKHTNKEFDIVSNPEFLKEGAAIDDFMRPDRIVVGTETDKARDIMLDLYSPFVRNNHPLLTMDIKSAEMTKYAANAMLATRISFMNEISLLCEKVGADIRKIREGIGSDPRIGMKFLYSGIGYGGSCFPKDVKAIINTAQDNGLDFDLLTAVEKTNEKQKSILAKKFEQYFSKLYKTENKDIPDIKDFFSSLKVALWGLSFKPNTDDMRESPAIVIINYLKQLGIKNITAFDPEAMKEAQKILGDKIKYSKTNYEAVIDADALFLCTEWNEFRTPDWELMKRSMNRPVIFDGRNIYKKEKMIKYGWVYDCIGVGTSPNGA